MSKTTFILGDRLFITVDYWDGHAYIGELDQSRDENGKLYQKKLLELSPEELAALTWVLEEVNIKEV